RAGEFPVCVWWRDGGPAGGWSRSGCSRVGGDSRHSTCACSHFSTFAILTFLRPLPESPALALVTRVGLSLSLLCLALAIATFALCRPLGGRGRPLHLNLSLCLFA
ncbi:AGRE1 protein, partial [Neodrepanis coruscans]|nr:AGRE1 protein [Neodrepanis coruscans]